MKAEHRKELQTNVLADRMGKMLQGIKEGPKSKSLTIWILAGLAVVLFGFWRYYANAKHTERSALWLNLDRADATPNADEAVRQFLAISKGHPGTMPGRAADFQAARTLLAQGLQYLASDKIKDFEKKTTERDDAIQKIVEARGLYQRLSRECRDYPLLIQESLMALAKCEEALTGIANPAESGQTYGSLEAALTLYKQLGSTYPNSFQGKAAAERIQVLQKKPAGDELSAEQFYAKLNEVAKAKPKLDLPSFPGIPGLETPKAEKDDRPAPSTTDPKSPPKSEKDEKPVPPAIDTKPAPKSEKDEKPVPPAIDTKSAPKSEKPEDKKDPIPAPKPESKDKPEKTEKKSP